LQPLEHPGFWWRPDHPDRHMPGVLIFRPGERARLELFDAFFPLPEALARVFTTHTEPIILGESSTGEKITLMGCAEFPG